jgi:D-erythronate 2-dehydrogenase
MLAGMNIVLTGAGGFIGRALVRRLLENRGRLAIERLTLIDLAVPPIEAEGVRVLTGSIADPALLAAAVALPTDLVFHLASVPGGMAERDFDLGRQVNLDATLALLEKARSTGRAPRFVFASSIAVLGASLPDPVDDSTPLRPTLSYGTHKVIGELLVEDFNRRGWIDGRSVRLPGVVARPPQRTGQLSAFMSDIIRELAAGRRYECPVGAESTTWLMSVHQAVDNLLHAALLQPTDVRTWTLPAVRSSMSELAAAVGTALGRDTAGLVTYQSNPELENCFGHYPRLLTPAAEAAGFRHDGSLDVLVRRALEPVT